MATFTKKGNAAGFTAKSEVVWGHYKEASKTWRVNVGDHPVLSDQRNQSFCTEREAAKYALSLMDVQKTSELAWW